MSLRSHNSESNKAALHSIDIVRDILREVGSVSRLMEIQYLVQEPGMLEIVYGLCRLSEEDRLRLQAFLARSDQGLTVRDTSEGLLLGSTAGERFDKSA